MIETLLKSSLRSAIAPFVLAAVIAGWGYYGFTNLTVEAFPDPTDTQVTVITLFPGQPTEEVERRVSIPLERALNGTPGLFRLRSISLFGLSSVTMTFQEGVDPLIARQQVLERSSQAELPDGVKPSLGPLATPIGEVFRYTLTSAGSTDVMTLRTLQEWVVRPRLLQVAGVADVVSYGGLIKEIHVEPDPQKMASLHVELEALFAALQKASHNASGGYVERGSEMFVIRSIGIFQNLEDIASVRVAHHGGVPVTVRDVAAVRVGYAPRQGIVSRSHDEDAVEGIVLMRRGENPSRVLDALRGAVDQLNGNDLPKDVAVTAFYDRTELVNSTLKTVFRNLTEGAVLVIGVLFVFLMSLRASLIVASIIPLSLLASFLYLHLRGMSANLLSMGAVDFGIIVDGAVILVEHLFHRVDAGGHPETLKARILHSAQEVARPTLFSLLIIIAAYIPIFSLQRVEGRIFGPMAHTVVSALVGALLFSFTLVPVLVWLALRRTTKPLADSPILRWLRKAYDPTLRVALANPGPILGLATCALVGALIVLPRLGSEFLPELNEGSLYVTFSLPGNMSLTEGRRLIPAIRERLLRTPEVQDVLSQLGRPEDGTDPTLPNNLEFFLKLRPLHEWRKGAYSPYDLVPEMETALQEIPGLEYNFSQPIRDNVNENIAGQFGQIALKIYGEDLNQLQKMAETAADTINAVPGASDVGIVKAGETPQLSVRLDRTALARYDLDLEDVQDYLETAMAGHTASDIFEGERRFDVTVRMPQITREDAGAIRNLMVPLKNGALIPVSAVAEVGMATGRAAITRENGKRYVGVRMNVRNRDMGSFVAEAQQKVASAMPLPDGYALLWGGEFENQQRAMARLQLVIPAALLITFVLLFSQFQSLFDSLLIMFNVPLALLGGVAGLAVVGMPLSVAAAVGFIALLGQAVLNGVLMVSAIRTEESHGRELYAAVWHGARDRLRAVLMTGLLAALGLLPAALSHEIGSETQRPIAVVVVAGTISAAGLTLVVLPVSYYWARRFLMWLRPNPEPPDEDME